MILHSTTHLSGYLGYRKSKDETIVKVIGMEKNNDIAEQMIYIIRENKDKEKILSLIENITESFNIPGSVMLFPYEIFRR
jgi:hypothetical protein